MTDRKRYTEELRREQLDEEHEQALTLAIEVLPRSVMRVLRGDDPDVETIVESLFEVSTSLAYSVGQRTDREAAQRFARTAFDTLLHHPGSVRFGCVARLAIEVLRGSVDT